MLSCMDRNEACAVPYSVIHQNRKNLNMTDRGDRSYWHVAVTTGGRLSSNQSVPNRFKTLSSILHVQWVCGFTTAGIGSLVQLLETGLVWTLKG